MAARRRTGSRSSASGARGRSQAQRPPNNAVPAVLAAGVLIAIVAMAVLAFGNRGEEGGDQDQGNRAPALDPAKVAEASGRPAEPEIRLPGSADVPGKAPARPAPQLDEDQLAEVQRLYVKAKELFNEAQSAKRAGSTDVGAYQDKMIAAKDACTKAREILSDVTRWDEEATFEGWAIPGHHRDTMKLWGKVNEIYTKAKKVSHAR